MALDLAYEETDRVDGTGSWHRFRGRYIRQVKKLGMSLLESFTLEDIFFAVRETESD